MERGKSNTEAPMRAAVASDEDLLMGFVHVGEHAPDETTALSALVAGAWHDWNVTIDPGAVIAKGRRWYWFDEDQEELYPCEADDPRRDSEWWTFDIANAVERDG